jgi:hypothetical protein
MKELSKMVQAPVPQTADRFFRKTEASRDVGVSGFAIGEKQCPQQFAASFGELLEDFPKKLFALRLEIDLQGVRVRIRQADGGVLGIVTALPILSTNEVIALADRDGEDPGTKSGRVVLKNLLPLVLIKVKPDRYGINHSFVPPQQTFPRL